MPASQARLPFSDDCPVSLDVLGTLYRGDAEVMETVLADIPSAPRARLATYLYGKSHLHALGLRVASALHRDRPGPGGRPCRGGAVRPVPHRAAQRRGPPSRPAPHQPRGQPLRRLSDKCRFLADPRLWSGEKPMLMAPPALATAPAERWQSG